MRIFQSEQVNKLRNVIVFCGKKQWPPNSPDLKQLDYYQRCFEYSSFEYKYEYLSYEYEYDYNTHK